MCRFGFFFATCLFLIVHCDVDPVQIDALIELFNSTGGTRWSVNSQWTIGDPCNNHWHGVTCDDETNSIIEKLDLVSNNLIGTIPETIGSLTALSDLYLYGNHLSGTLPSTVSNLTVLQDLYLSDNLLSGIILDTIGSLTALQSLDLSDNQLSGTIPSTIGSLTALSYLFLASNQLSGTIPDTIGSLTALVLLDLNKNQLSGSIPETIGSLTALSYLFLDSNQLSGTIPDTIGSLTALSDLFLDNNKLSGTIPDTIGSLSLLQELFLSSNQLSGTIPETIGSLTALSYLFLSDNQLSGTIPDTISSLTALKSLYLADNQLSGTIPSTIGSLTVLQDLFLDNNQLSGTIPDAIGSLIELYQLFLGDNQLSGTIPETIGSLTGLHFLLLENNQVSGTIPSTIASLTALMLLELQKNNICGGCFPFPPQNWLYCNVIGINFNCSCPYPPCNSSCNPNFTCPDSSVPFISKFIGDDDGIQMEPQQALLPFILSQKKEQPPSFKESIAIAYGSDLDDFFVDTNIQHGTSIYKSLCLSEENFDMTLEEMLAIYFFTLESTPIFNRLNKDITSKDYQSSLPKWRFYLYFLFEGLKKIPIWKESHDLYRGVSMDLVSKYPQTYVTGNVITWFGITSTTTNIEVMKKLIGDNTSGFTIFSIESSFSGRSISKFSAHPSECEVLLPPGSSFEIVGIFSLSKSQIKLIQLKQIPSL